MLTSEQARLLTTEIDELLAQRPHLSLASRWELLAIAFLVNLYADLHQHYQQLEDTPDERHP